MKILLVSPKMEKPNGGIATWTNIYLDSCSDVGIEPFVLNTEPIGKRADNGNAKRNFLDEIVRTRRIFKDLRALLKRDTYDVAHINSSCGKFGLIRDYMVAKRIKEKQPNTKIVLHFHCDVPYQVKNKTSEKYLQKLLGISDKNLVLCENSKKYLEEKFSAESIKVPNFVNEDIVTKGCREVSASIKKAFFVGRISTAKGAREIYEIANRFPEISFELAGNVSVQVTEWKKPDNIILLGLLSHSDVLAKMDEADIFLFPTHSEGFSMALAEAMSRGLPTVTTDVGANKDMIEYKGGVIVSVGDVDAMQNAINSIIEKNVREQMSKWSVQKVRDCYLTQRVMKSFAEIYKEC